MSETRVIVIKESGSGPIRVPDFWHQVANGEVPVEFEHVGDGSCHCNQHHEWRFLRTRTETRLEIAWFTDDALHVVRVKPGEVLPADSSDFEARYKTRRDLLDVPVAEVYHCTRCLAKREVPVG